MNLAFNGRDVSSAAIPPDIISSVPMYRIELAPGEEALFKSIDEMAAGIANGVISSKARIWHQTSAKWLPIEFHPHYKIALTKGPQTTLRADYREAPSVAGPAAASTPPIFDQAPRPLFEPPTAKPIVEPPAPKSLFEPPTPKSIFERPATAPSAAAPAAAPSPFAPPSAKPLFEKPAPEYQLSPDAQPAPIAILAPAPSAESYEDLGSDYIEIHPPRGRGRTWTVGAAAAVAIVVLGGGAAFSAFRSSRTPAPRPATPVAPSPASYGAQPVVTPATPSFGSRTSRPASDTADAKTDVPSGKIADAPHITEAPKVSLSSLSLSDSDRPASDRPSSVTPAVLVAHYASAYDGARAELDRGIQLANLGSIFAAARLVPGQVGSARTTIAGVANLVRVYRKRSATIEQTYRDSVNLLTRQIGWSPSQIAIWEKRPTQLESPELAAMANALLDAMDGVLEVISTNEGGYQISGSTISFDDAGATRAYSAARRRLAGLAGSGADSGTPAGRLLRALGRALPPDEKSGS